jgi:hypothetical protein
MNELITVTETARVAEGMTAAVGVALTEQGVCCG